MQNKVIIEISSSVCQSFISSREREKTASLSKNSWNRIFIRHWVDTFSGYAHDTQSACNTESKANSIRRLFFLQFINFRQMSSESILSVIVCKNTWARKFSSLVDENENQRKMIASKVILSAVYHVVNRCWRQKHRKREEKYVKNLRI